MTGALQTDLRPAAELTTAWEELADRVGATPFDRPGWLLAWHQTFGRRPLRLVCAWRDDELCAALPVSGRAGFLASPTNWHTPAFGVLATDAEAFTAVVEAAVSQVRGQLVLSFVDPTTAERVEAIAHRLGRSSGSRVLQRSPYVATASVDWEKYEQSLSKDTRKGVRRRERRLEELGAVITRTSDRVQGSYAEFLELEDSGWKAEQGTSIRRDQRARDFYDQVVEWAERQGWLRIGLLEAGERPVAAVLALEALGVHYGLKTGYDETLRRYAPAKLLHYSMIRRSFEEGHASYEFLGDDEPWKSEWAPEVHERLEVHVFGPGPLGHLMRQAQVRVRPALRRLRERWRERRARAAD